MVFREISRLQSIADYYDVDRSDGHGRVESVQVFEIVLKVRNSAANRS